MSLFFGDSLRTLTTLLILGVLCYIWITTANRRRITSWGSRVWCLFALGFTACVFAAARDGYYLSVKASDNPGIQPGLFATGSFQSVLCSLGGAVILLCSLSSLLVKSQEYRRAVFFVLSAIITVKILLIEAARIGM